MKKTRNHRTRSRELDQRPLHVPAAVGRPQTPSTSSLTTHHPSSPLGRATPVQSKLVLPVPIYTPVDHTKKSHARKQPAGHIPRPRNAFILFRCNFVDQDKIPASVERDHRNISRIVGSLWRKMSDAEKEPWVRMADDEKRAHFLAYPGYRFSRSLASNARPTATRRKHGDDTASSRGSSSPKSNMSVLQPLADPLYLSVPGHGVDHRSSCTTGSVGIPTGRLEPLDVFPEPIISREELARRPSRVMLSESALYEDFYSSFDDIHAPGGYGMETADQMVQYISNETPESRHRFQAQSHTPRFNDIRVPTAGMSHPSQLGVLDTWDEYHAAQRQQGTTPPRKEPTQDELEYSSLIMAHAIDLDLSPTLPPLPLPHTPDRADGEYYYEAPASPIERKNSFYSPRSGTWRLPLPIVTSNCGSGAISTSNSHIDSGLSFPDNLIDDELRYPDAKELSGRTRASLSWAFDRPSYNDRSAHVNQHETQLHEAQTEHRGLWGSSLREVESSAKDSHSE
ncbi:hypothetical protein D9619_008358 [Psilocybe cf. subviscida]|uniref:HMG box domain-containing protein n=1 Tax=Psilocybe cf. subviscida TaxID=2480587 RepID=A0A8H5BAC4_9AGAR|nr:hypothetical protein D9619_008358 [Psilocybe cf. subviscida]